MSRPQAFWMQTHSMLPYHPNTILSPYMTPCPSLPCPSLRPPSGHVARTSAPASRALTTLPTIYLHRQLGFSSLDPPVSDSSSFERHPSKSRNVGIPSPYISQKRLSFSTTHPYGKSQHPIAAVLKDRRYVTSIHPILRYKA